MNSLTPPNRSLYKSPFLFGTDSTDSLSSIRSTFLVGATISSGILGALAGGLMGGKRGAFWGAGLGSVAGYLYEKHVQVSDAIANLTPAARVEPFVHNGINAKYNFDTSVGHTIAQNLLPTAITMKLGDVLTLTTPAQGAIPMVIGGLTQIGDTMPGLPSQALATTDTRTFGYQATTLGNAQISYFPTSNEFFKDSFTLFILITS